MLSISRPSRGHPVGWALLAAACLFAGYLDLWRGGTSLAAVLLTVGYLVLVPAAIRAWYRGGPPVATEATGAKDLVMLAESPPYLAATAVSLTVFVLYVLTLAPSTAMWDASEYIAAAYVLGIPHPPGNPFFILLGRVFSILPLGGNCAARSGW